jgi:hypothetical protein
MAHTKVSVAMVVCECSMRPAPDHSELKEQINPIPTFPSGVGVN